MFNWGCFSSRGRRDLFFLLASCRMRGRTFLRSRSASYVCSSLPNVGVLVVHPVSMGWVSHHVHQVWVCGCVQHSPCVPWIGRDGFQTTHPFNTPVSHTVFVPGWPRTTGGTQTPTPRTATVATITAVWATRGTVAIQRRIWNPRRRQEDMLVKRKESH